MTEQYERHLWEKHLSENTITAYLFALRQFRQRYGTVTQTNLCRYKSWLMEYYKPQTVNLRLQVNCYLESVGREKWRLPSELPGPVYQRRQAAVNLYFPGPSAGG